MIRIAGGLVGALAVVTAWLWLAPANLGGGTSYVVLYGSSMEPRYHGGDLVLARPADDYAVGDVVAYHHPQLGRTVLHRIVARDGDRFQFKGDGNDFRDLPRPSRVQVIGREWVHVPRAGAALEWIRQPAHAALAVLALVLLLAGGGGAEVTRRRSRQGDVPLAELVRTTARDEQGRRALRGDVGRRRPRARGPRRGRDRLRAAARGVGVLAGSLAAGRASHLRGGRPSLHGLPVGAHHHR